MLYGFQTENTYSALCFNMGDLFCTQVDLFIDGPLHNVSFGFVGKRALSRDCRQSASPFDVGARAPQDACQQANP